MKKKEKDIVNVSNGEGDDEVDRLSQLPEDVLLAILDRLDTCDAARAGVLARRWRRLPAMVSRISIDCSAFRRPTSSSEIIHDDDVPRINRLVREATKSMLLRRRGDADDDGRRAIILSSIAIKFFLRDLDYIDIGRTVARALARNKVERVEFTLLSDMRWMNGHLLPSPLSEFVYFCTDAFAALTHLVLENLVLGWCDVPKALRACGRLRRLRMKNCLSLRPLATLRIHHSHLTELAIVNCEFQGVELRRLPKLTEFSFQAWSTYEEEKDPLPLCFGTVPLLESVRIRRNNNCHSSHEAVRMSELLRGTRVRKLVLHFDSAKVWVEPEGPKSLASVFRRLRVLRLLKLPKGLDPAWTMFVLEAAPSLEELCLAVWHRDHAHTSEEKEKQGGRAAAFPFQHRSLGSLVIHGFRSEKRLMRYVRRVMKLAVNLREVLLYGRVGCEECKVRRSQGGYPTTHRDMRSLRKKIAEGTGSQATIIFPTSTNQQQQGL